MSVPPDLPMWAVDDQIDPVSLSNNVLPPPPELQQYGWVRSQFPPRNFFNWLGRQTYECLLYLFDKDALIVSSVGAGAQTLFNTTVGGMYKLSVVDQGNPANFYEGVGWSAPAPGAPVTLTDITTSPLSVSTISTSGVVTVSGGTGPYQCYAQTIPSP